MSVRKVRLIEVRGNQEEFSDLIGTEGKLRLDEKDKDSEVNWYCPDKNIDAMVSLSRKRVTEKDGLVSVSTRRGNTFVFKLKEVGGG